MSRWHYTSSKEPIQFKGQDMIAACGKIVPNAEKLFDVKLDEGIVPLSGCDKCRVFVEADLRNNGMNGEYLIYAISTSETALRINREIE